MWQQEVLGAWFPNMPMLPERVKRLREVGTVLMNGTTLI